jgi:adenylate kinase family enzyme
MESEELDKMKLAKELGDVLWYISAIATTTGIHLEDVAALNAAKLEHRHQGSFNTEFSANRHEREGEFTNTPIYKAIEARINMRGDGAPVNVIFLGPDGSGKTTISKDVAQRLGFTYQKCDYRQPRKQELSLNLLKTQENMVYDRFYYPDDMIYCKVKDIQQSEEYWSRYEAVDRELNQLNTIIVFITASNEVLKERSKVWADDYVATTDLPAIKDLYENFLNYTEQTNIVVLAYDTSLITADSVDYTSLIDIITNDIAIERARFGGVLSEDN